VEKTELEIKGLRLTRGSNWTLNVPSFELRKGECLVLFGPNGAGKSTFLRIAALLEEADSGEIYYQGRLVTDDNRTELGRRAVYLLQKPVFFKGTVRDNLLLGLKFRRFESSEQLKRLETISDLFQLEPYLDRSPFELSGGEKQRVHLARAFIIQPDFLFLDEPFNGLDVDLKDLLLEDFSRIRKSTGTTTILVTHNRDEAAFLADRIMVMIDGEIVQAGPVEEVFSRPATPDISRLLGHETLVEGIAVGEEQGLLKISAHGQTIQAYGLAQPGQRVILTFRPEEVILTRDRPRTSVRNWFYGPVEEIKSFDRMILVSVNCGFNLKALISRASLEELNLQPGEQVWAGIKASALTVAAP